MFATIPLRRRETLTLHKSTQEGNNRETHGGSEQQRVEEQEYRREGLQDKNKALKSQN